jgi:predicted glutamine amidotransferase
MCHLNLLITNEIPSERVLAFLASVTTVSYSTNQHGDGIYLDTGLLKKTKEKLDLHDAPLREKVADAKFFLTHQRIATSGFSEKNLQPFEEEEFVLMHNGVLRHYENSSDNSDTRNFFDAFLKHFNESVFGGREERIFQALNDLLKDSYGYWSIAIFDKRMQTFYYLKDQRATISLFQTKKGNSIYLTTSYQNQAFLPITGQEWVKDDIENYALYKAKFSDDGLVFAKVGTFDQQQDAQQQLDWGYGGYTTTVASRETEREERESLRPDLRAKQKKKSKCEYCEIPTNDIMAYTGSVICYECFFDNEEDLISNEDYVMRVSNAHFPQDIQHQYDERGCEDEGR